MALPGRLCTRRRRRSISSREFNAIEVFQMYLLTVPLTAFYWLPDICALEVHPFKTGLSEEIQKLVPKG